MNAAFSLWLMWGLPTCRRPHQSLAAVGVAALVRLLVATGDRMSAATWVEAVGTLSSCAADTRPAVRELVAAVRTPRPTGDGAGGPPATAGPGGGAGDAVPEDNPWEAKSPGDSPRAAVPTSPLDRTASGRRQV
jgi:brefeldin A-inhibited guanine nucleotide-exchange protein